MELSCDQVKILFPESTSHNVLKYHVKIFLPLGLDIVVSQRDLKFLSDNFSGAFGYSILDWAVIFALCPQPPDWEFESYSADILRDMRSAFVMGHGDARPYSYIDTYQYSIIGLVKFLRHMKAHD